jgi:hypothetical protein
MEFTVEQRHLLQGDETREGRKEKCLGFGDATLAPDWAKARIIQVRSAIVERRAIPAPSRAFIAGCEQRSIAQRHAVPVVKRDDELEALKRKAHGQGQVIFGEQRRAREEADARRRRAAALLNDIREAAGQL